MARTPVVVGLACVAVGGLLVAGGTLGGDRSAPVGADPPAPTTAATVHAKTSAPPEIPVEGTGRFIRAEGTTRRAGTGKVLRYRVEVEDGTGQDVADFARWVDRILADRRGWTAGGRWAFVRVRAAPVDFVVRLATPATADSICGRYGLRTDGEASCRGQENVVVNLRRWLLAIPAYRGDVTAYRHLVVNHEVGHFLGHRHVSCPGRGRPAPVMQTQMYGLHGCRPNAWPYVNGRYVG